MLPLTASRRSSLVATAGAALGLPVAHHLGDREHDLLAVAEHRGVEEVGDRLGVERGVAAGEHDRVVVGAVDGVQRDAGQVEGVEHVGVAELGGEAQAEHVEVAHRAVGVDGELRDRALVVAGAQHLLHVRPDRVGALGEDPVALVEHLVEDLDALVGQSDLVGVGIHQRPADGLAPRAPQSQSLSVEFSSPPTYWIGFDTDGSRGSRRGKTDSGRSRARTSDRPRSSDQGEIGKPPEYVGRQRAANRRAGYGRSPPPRPARRPGPRWPAAPRAASAAGSGRRARRHPRPSRKTVLHRVGEADLERVREDRVHLVDDRGVVLDLAEDAAVGRRVLRAPRRPAG